MLELWNSKGIHTVKKPRAPCSMCFTTSLNIKCVIKSQLTYGNHGWLRFASKLWWDWPGIQAAPFSLHWSKSCLTFLWEYPRVIYLFCWLWYIVKQCHRGMVPRLLLTKQACRRVVVIILGKKKHKRTFSDSEFLHSNSSTELLYH